MDVGATETTFGLSEDMEVCRAVEDDMDYMISCVRRSVEQSVDEIERNMSDLWIESILNIARSSMLERRMDDETFVLKMRDGSYAGSLWLGTSADQFTCEITGYILGIFVEPEFRRKGIGSALLRYAEDWCRERGFLSLTLNVGWQNESARSFYESHGYNVRSEVRRKNLYPHL
jgi:GNAT superfamily N-acetyltransferase